MKNKLFYILLGLSLSLCLTSCSCSRDTNAIVSLSDINTIEFSEDEEIIEQQVIDTLSGSDVISVSSNDVVTVSTGDAEPTVSTGDAEPVVDVTPEPVVEAPKFTVTAYDATMYATKSVNLRKGPSTDYDKVGSLKLNDEVKVTGKVNGSTWFEIEVKGEKVYVSSKYLSNEKTVVAPTPAPAPSTSTPAATPSAPAASTGYEDMVIDGYRIGDYEHKVKDGWLCIKEPGQPGWTQMLEVEPHVEEPEEEFNPHEGMAYTIRMRHWEVGGVYTVYEKYLTGSAAYEKMTYHVTAVDDYYITDVTGITAEEYFEATGTY